MFGINRKELIKNLEIIRKHLCCYTVPELCIPEWCDCKYGPELDPNNKLGLNNVALTERTGCPELRHVISILENMTDEDFKCLSNKGNVIIT
jgi:hypothetical protein